MEALAQAVASGKGTLLGISDYNPAQTSEPIRILHSLGTPCLIHRMIFDARPRAARPRWFSRRTRRFHMCLKPAASLIIPVLVILCALSSMAQQQTEDIQMWLTTADRSALLSLQPNRLHFSTSSGTEPAIEVNDMAQYQRMEGFGLAVTGGSAQLLMRMEPAQRTALLEELFGTKRDDIKISYIRVSIGSSDMNDHAYTYDDLPPGQADKNLDKFSLAPDRVDVIPVLKEILSINPEMKILGSPWSAPAWMKTSDKLKGGHLKPEYYEAYAKYLAKYVKDMKAEGVPLDTITVENEPLNPKNTPSMVLFALEEAMFVARHLGPAFQKEGISSKILLYDHNPDVPSYPLSILADPEASKYVAGTAFHLYGGDVSTLTTVHNEYPNKNLYMTEQDVSEGSAGPLEIAEAVRRVPIAAVRNWSLNVLLWNLAADSHLGPHTNDGGCTTCMGAITLEGNRVTRNLAYYTIAHFSKFAGPGSMRIASSEAEQLATAAFLNSDHKIVLVVSNTANFDRTFSVMYHGQSFTTTLPEESAGTYVW
jgi:glucosylceramidase